MAALTIKTVFAAVNKMTQPIRVMQSQMGRFIASANKATAGIRKVRGIIARGLGGLASKGEE